MKQLDIPPLWLAAALVLAYQLRGAFGMTLAGPVTQLLAGLLVGGGLLVMGLAVLELRRWRTTLWPHGTPSHLVTSGIFKRSRNPIYLGDAMVLLGMILFWDAPLALPLVPVFMMGLERRFILPEENRLRRSYRADYARYLKATRRWL